MSLSSKMMKDIEETRLNQTLCKQAGDTRIAIANIRSHYNL